MMDAADIVGWTPKERAAAMNARAAEERDAGFDDGAAAEQRKCCEDICHLCKRHALGNADISQAEPANAEGQWQHYRHRVGLRPCLASAIYERAAEGN